MANFLCRVASEDGRLLSLTRLASSSAECRSRLEAEGYHILSISRDWRKLELAGIRFGKKIKDKDFILFNQELVALLKSGYPVLRSLEVIAGRAKNIYLKELLRRVEDDVRAGKALSEAFQPYESRFSKVYIAALMAGERSGNLPGTLSRYIQYARVIAQTRSKVRSALAYPTVLLIFSFVLVAILVNFILPRFESFYRDFEARLPAMTRFMMAVAVGVRRQMPLILLGLAVLVLITLRLRKRETTRIWLDRQLLRIPFGRAIWSESAISLFARTLGLLLEAGISVLHSLGVAQQAVPNKSLAFRLRSLPEAIKNGESLSDALGRTEVVPPLALDMVRIGETSANLPGMLAEVADFYDERIRARIDTLVSLIEPIIIIMMGVVVAGMLLAVYLPIFNIIQVAR